MSEAEKNELRRKNNESQKRRREKKRIAMLAENLISDSMTENPILFKEESSETDYEYRGVVPGLAEGAMAPPDFGRPLNPISAKGGTLFPPNNTGTPGFSDLPTALIMFFILSCFQWKTYVHCVTNHLRKITS